MPERQVHVLPSFHSQMMNMICFVFPTQDEINDLGDGMYLCAGEA